MNSVLNKGRNNATIIVTAIVTKQLADIEHWTGLEFIVDCWSHVSLWMCLVINGVLT